jgi:hypothetical protein
MVVVITTPLGASSVRTTVPLHGDVWGLGGGGGGGGGGVG